MSRKCYEIEKVLYQDMTSTFLYRCKLTIPCSNGWIIRPSNVWYYPCECHTHHHKQSAWFNLVPVCYLRIFLNCKNICSILYKFSPIPVRLLSGKLIAYLQEMKWSFIVTTKKYKNTKLIWWSKFAWDSKTSHFVVEVHYCSLEGGTNFH